jgi:small subunit ribosomal protein S10
MPNRSRIRLSSINKEKLDTVVVQIKQIVDKTGVKMSGPVALPTKKIKVPVLKTPCGEGTATWERWEMRVHKRLIDISADDRTMRMIMRIKVPDDVYIEITIS